MARGKRGDDVLEELSDPKNIQKLAEAVKNINRLFRELESARVALCFSILLEEDRERILLRVLRYAAVLNILKRIYGKEEVDPNILLTEMIDKCKETYEVIYVDGRYRMLPKKSKVYHQLMGRIEREYPYNPYK